MIQKYGMIITIILVFLSLISTTAIAETTRPLMPTSPTLTPIDLDTYNDTIVSIFGNGSWDNVSAEGVVNAFWEPYVDALGPVAYILLFGSLALVMYIKTESIMLPGIITMADGALFMWLLPYDWQYVAYGFVLIGSVITIIGLVLRKR